MKNEKKVGTPILGSRELKLFEPVVVEFMLQELGFHVAHIQSCFYHIYVWASARIKNFHLGSAGGSVSADEYVFLCGGGSNRSFTLAAHFRVIPFSRSM